MAYLGYDPCGLEVLRGALADLDLERLPVPTRPDPWSAAAIEHHRRAVAAVAAFAEPIGAILHGDPLGRFLPVQLDPSDLWWWAWRRDGRWSTVTDPTLPPGGPQLDPAVQNARLLADTLTPEQLKTWLTGTGSGAAPLARYLDLLAADRGVRQAFLEALGPDRFRRLLEVTAGAVVSRHQHAGPDPEGTNLARRVLDGLGRAWATTRAEGGLRTPAWDDAALGDDLAASSRLLAIAARVAEALSPGELARWSAALWDRLVTGIGTKRAPWPELVGTNVLMALVTDGRAARRFLLDLADERDGHGLAFLLTDIATSPALSGELLLSATQPSTVVDAADQAEAGRIVQVILRAMARLLDGQLAVFPRVAPDGSIASAGGAWVLPSGLGLFAGRYVEQLIDPCDGARTGACPITGPTWSGWKDREVAHVLGLLASDRQAESDLSDAAAAGYLHRLQTLDLTDPASVHPLQDAAFVVAAVNALQRNVKLERTIDAAAWFDRMTAGLDLTMAAAGTALPEIEPVVAGADVWSWSSHAGAAGGVGTPGGLVLSPLRPQSVRDALGDVPGR